MMKIKPLSCSFLSLGGVLLILTGIFFIFFRHPLLPEDSRYIGTSLNEIKDKVPGLTVWLQKVFFVLGSFILTTGLFTVYIYPKHPSGERSRAYSSLF